MLTGTGRDWLPGTGATRVVSQSSAGSRRGVGSAVSGVPPTGGESPPDQAPFAVRLGPGSGPGQTVVTVAGDVDMHSADRLRDALTEAGPVPGGRVVVDLSGVEFMASAGVHVLLDVARRFEQAGGALVLASPRPMVARVLSLTRADELIPTAATVDEALAG